MIIVPVPLADGRSYDVIVGDGAVHELGTLIPAKAKRAAIVTQASIPLTVETGMSTNSSNNGVHNSPLCVKSLSQNHKQLT